MRRRSGKDRHGARWARRTVRLLGLVVLALFLGQMSLAFAAPILIQAAGAEQRGPCCPGEDDDDEDCPCPSNCVMCFAVTPVRAVSPLPFESVAPASLVIELAFVPITQRPLTAEPTEILHIPKA